MTREDEIEAFKSGINLSEYAASLGYSLDRDRTSRNCCMMERGKGDKIALGMGQDGHWLYYTIDDWDDQGSIIDFVQNRIGGSLGSVRKELRPWLGTSGSFGPRPDPANYSLKLEPVTKDLLQVKMNLSQMAPINGKHSYLEESRGIPAGVLRSELFKGRILIDKRGNAVFPHSNQDGLCGYEIKNEGFTGFAPGGSKGIWYSNFHSDDKRLVIAETAIDALSYAALRPGIIRSRFFSVGGAMNENQPALLTSALEKLPQDAEIVLAMDNDEGGDLMAEKIKAVFLESGVSDTRFFLDRPPSRGEDWNDALRASMGERISSG